MKGIHNLKFKLNNLLFSSYNYILSNTEHMINKNNITQNKKFSFQNSSEKKVLNIKPKVNFIYNDIKISDKINLNEINDIKS